MNAVEVCNLALGRIGEGASRPIQSLTESSEAARACNRVFAITLRALLREFAWPFAQTYVALAPVAQTVPGWDYVYAYPADCLFLHGLGGSEVDPARNPALRHPYKIIAASSGESSVIATDVSDAWAHYTRDVTSPHVGDPLFHDALAWRIASEVAIGLKASPQMAQSAAQQYQVALSKAVAAYGNEDGDDRVPDDEIVRAAYGAPHPYPWEPNGWA